MNKINLIAYAKGEEQKQPGISICLNRNDNGLVYVTSAEIIKSHEVDIVIKIINNREDIEFWKTFDTLPLLEETKNRLLGDKDSTKKQMCISVQSTLAAEEIEKLYSKDS